jgi:hypothetical protein
VNESYIGQEAQIRENAESDQFHGREEITDLEGGGFRGVGAVGAVHLDAGAQVVANGAGGGLLGVGGTHRVTPFGDGAVGFEDHGEDFAGTHEVGEFTEKRALAMDGVKPAGFFFGEAQGFDGDEFEGSFVNARENFALQIATDRVGLDDRKSTFECHEFSSEIHRSAGLKPGLHRIRKVA